MARNIKLPFTIQGSHSQKIGEEMIRNCKLLSDFGGQTLEQNQLIYKTFFNFYVT